jgi:hypothetical protein
MTKQKHSYFIPESETAQANFKTEWEQVETDLSSIMPLMDNEGEIVGYETLVTDIDFSEIAEVLPDAPEDMLERFMAEVKKKNPKMTAKDLLARPAAELTRWRKMGNRITLFPNALVLHMNLL